MPWNVMGCHGMRDFENLLNHKYGNLDTDKMTNDYVTVVQVVASNTSSPWAVNVLRLQKQKQKHTGGDRDLTSSSRQFVVVSLRPQSPSSHPTLFASLGRFWILSAMAADNIRRLRKTIGCHSMQLKRTCKDYKEIVRVKYTPKEIIQR